MDEKKKKIKKPRGVARLIPGKCIACGARCQTSCPKEGVEMNDKGEPVFNAPLCIGCAKCVKVCPAEAIEMYLTPEEQKTLAEWEAQRTAASGVVKVEEALQESEKKYRAFFKDSIDAVVISTVDGKILDFNDSLMSLTGYERDELLSMNVVKLYANPADRVMFEGEIQKTGLVKEYGVKWIKKDGIAIDVVMTLNARRDEDGNIIGYQGIVRDITERKRAEEALQESEKKYRALFEDSIDAVIISTVDGKILDFNDSLMSLTGYERDELLATNAVKLYANPADRVMFEGEIQKNGLVKEYGVKWIKKDGTAIDVVMTLTARRDEDGNIIGYQGIVRDINERKRAEEADEADEEDEKEVGVPAALREYRGVWVFVEQSDGQSATVSWELLGVGAELAKKLSVELCAIVIGDKVEHLCEEAFSYGASKAYLVDDPVYKHYRTESYYKAVCHLVRKYKPEIVLVGATGLGRDLAGAVATDLLTGLTADCTGLAIDDKGFLLQTRPAFGGNIMATIMTEKTRPQMSTVRPHVMSMPPCDHARKGTVIVEQSPVKENDILVKVLQIIEDSRQGADAIDVSAADVIVSGGRGMLSKDNFRILQELADELGGVVGCSRAAVEAGYMPVERQVGQTGKTVRPKIYIACAISGAIQHLVGMQDSDVIIAVNRDHHAPIFEVATYGIVGDVFQVIPAITKRLKDLKVQKVAC